MAGVFLARTQRATAEVINDINSDIYNLFRLVQRHPQQLKEVIHYHLTSRQEYYCLGKTNPDTLTDLEKAARFLYRLRLTFGTKPIGNSYGVSKSTAARFNSFKVCTLIDNVHAYLTHVAIENLDYKDFIKRYDGPQTLFYLDPPYYGHENDYGKNIFARDDFEYLSHILANIEGAFILSINVHPEIQRLFANFTIIPVKTSYSINNAYNKKVTEFIISNRDISKYAQAS